MAKVFRVKETTNEVDFLDWSIRASVSGSWVVLEVNGDPKVEVAPDGTITIFKRDLASALGLTEDQIKVDVRT